MWYRRRTTPGRRFARQGRRPRSLNLPRSQIRNDASPSHRHRRVQVALPQTAPRKSTANRALVGFASALSTDPTPHATWLKSSRRRASLATGTFTRAPSRSVDLSHRRSLKSCGYTLKEEAVLSFLITIGSNPVPQPARLIRASNHQAHTHADSLSLHS